MSVNGFSFFANLLRVLIYDESTRCHPSDRLVGHPVDSLKASVNLEINHHLGYFLRQVHLDKFVLLRAFDNVFYVT